MDKRVKKLYPIWLVLLISLQVIASATIIYIQQNYSDTITYIGEQIRINREKLNVIRKLRISLNEEVRDLSYEKKHVETVSAAIYAVERIQNTNGNKLKIPHTINNNTIYKNKAFGTYQIIARSRYNHFLCSFYHLLHLTSATDLIHNKTVFLTKDGYKNIKSALEEAYSKAFRGPDLSEAATNALIAEKEKLSSIIYSVLKTGVDHSEAEEKLRVLLDREGLLYDINELLSWVRAWNIVQSSLVSSAFEKQTLDVCKMIDSVVGDMIKNELSLHDQMIHYIALKSRINILLLFITCILSILICIVTFYYDNLRLADIRKTIFTEIKMNNANILRSIKKSKPNN